MGCGSSTEAVVPDASNSNSSKKAQTPDAPSSDAANISPGSRKNSDLVGVGVVDDGDSKNNTLNSTNGNRTKSTVNNSGSEALDETLNFTTNNAAEPEEEDVLNFSTSLNDSSSPANQNNNNKSSSPNIGGSFHIEDDVDELASSGTALRRQNSLKSPRNPGSKRVAAAMSPKSSFRRPGNSSSPPVRAAGGTMLKPPGKSGAATARTANPGTSSRSNVVAAGASASLRYGMKSGNKK